jgi:hypothetical protein
MSLSLKWRPRQRDGPLTFDPLAYRKQDEGSAIRTLAEMSAFASSASPLTFLVRVFDSEFLEWFSRESEGMYDSRNPHHYRVFTVNSVIEILALSPPEFAERSA